MFVDFSKWQQEMILTVINLLMDSIQMTLIDCHDKVNELNDSDLEISSIPSSDDDDGQSDIDISSVDSSDDNNDTQSESSIECIGEDGNDDGEQLHTNPV